MALQEDANPDLPDRFRKFEEKKPFKLAHEYGNGAPCSNCTSCPGLELHFWRKCCKLCKCSLNDHDVQDDDFQQYDYVFDEKKKKPIVHKYKGKDTEFDWAPKDPSLVEDYMSSLPEKWQPISGTAGAVYRQKQLAKQLPKYDIYFLPHSSPLSHDAEKRFIEYREDLRNNIAGLGEVAKLENLYWATPAMANISDDESTDPQYSESLKKPGGISNIISCKSCDKPMKNNAVVVTAPKMGQAVWHAPCFTCSDCGELLVDLHYFNHDGKIYCGRDYAKAINKPRCKACDELIFDLKFVTAGAFFYHEHHFCCFRCDTPLGGQLHFSANNNIYCVKCYEEENPKKCFTCKKNVSLLEPRLQVGLNVYHQNLECFRCGKCNKPLEGNRIFTAASLVICSSCSH